MGKTAKLFGNTLRVSTTNGWTYDHLMHVQKMLGKNVENWVSRSQAIHCVMQVMNRRFND